MFLNKVIAVESVPINDVSLVNTSLNDSSRDLNASTISEYELVSKRKISSFLLDKYTLRTAQSFICFIENLKSLSNEQKVGLLRFDKEKVPEESFATFIKQFYAPFIKDPVVCQRLLCLYQELKPIGSDSVSPKSHDMFSEAKKRILTLNVDQSVAEQFVDFVSKLDIKQSSVGRNPKAVLLESFESQDQEKFKKVLLFYSKILYPDVSTKLRDMMRESLEVPEFNPGEILHTSTPSSTLERKSTPSLLPKEKLVIGLEPPNIKQLAKEYKQKIRKMFALPKKVDARLAILDGLKKNENGKAIVEHLLKNNWRLFLGHSKFKEDLKLLKFSQKSSVLDTSAGLY